MLLACTVDVRTLITVRTAERERKKAGRERAGSERGGGRSNLQRSSSFVRPELSTIITLKKLTCLPPPWHQCQKPSAELDPMLLSPLGA